MKFRYLSFALATAVPALFAQAPPPVTKVGVINIQQAILSTKDGQRSAQELQVRFDPRRKEIDRKNGEIQAMQEQFRKTQNTASEEQRTKLARDVDQRQKSLQRDMEDAQAEFEQEQGKVLNELGGRLMQVIDKYSRDNAYTLILDVSNPQTPVLYMANGTDITAEIVKLYDANAPAPAATKPAGTPAAPMTVAPRPTTLTTPPAVKPSVPAPKPAGAKP